jgi:acyl-coenzyme A thioesterase PaaI-like protein
VDPDLLAVWFPRAEDVGPAWQRRHAVAAQLRAAAEALVAVDAEHADQDALEALIAEAAALRRRIAALPDVRHDTPWLSSVAGPAGALFERSPFSGRSNPSAPPLTIEHRDGVTRAHATFGDQHQGPPGGVHGGMVAGVFDELLGVAQVHSGSAGHTGTLTVVYRGLTPLHTRVDYEAGLDRREGRKLFVWGRSTVDGTVIVEAQGIFIVPRAASAADSIR